MDVDDLEFGGTNETPPPEQTPSNEPEVIEDLSSPMLAKIPPQDRAIVARYLKEWDAGANKKFRDYVSKLKPYEALGNVDELTKYANFARNFQANPENVFKLMWQGMQEQYGEEFDKELLRILGLEGVQMDDSNVNYQEQGGQPDPDEVFRQNTSKELDELRAWRQQMEEQFQSEEENRQLDELLGAMHNRHGEFDDNWVLQRLSEHGNPEQAIKEWQAMLGKYSQGTQQRQVPPRIPGGSQGGVPNGQIDPAKLRGEDRQNHVIALLRAAQGDQ